MDQVKAIGKSPDENQRPPRKRSAQPGDLGISRRHQQRRRPQAHEKVPKWQRHDPAVTKPNAGDRQHQQRRQPQQRRSGRGPPQGRERATPAVSDVSSENAQGEQPNVLRAEALMSTRGSAPRGVALPTNTKA